MRSVKNRFGSTDEVPFIYYLFSFFNIFSFIIYSSHYYITRPIYNVADHSFSSQMGVFEMSNTGLQAVLNPSAMFLSEIDSDSDISVGLAIAVIVDGSRTFVLEIQVFLFSTVFHAFVYFHIYLFLLLACWILVGWL